MNDSFLFSRRKFLKTVTLLTATSSLAGRTWTNTVVAQLLPKGGVLRVKLSDFPALQADFGSVRIGTSEVKQAGTPDAPNCTKPLNTIPELYPIIINRAPGNQFHALNSACTHAACAVAKLTGGATGSMLCSGHGSRFRINGTVINGPANFPLTSYAVQFDGTDTLKITLPDIFFEFSTLGVVPSNTNKFGLNFLASTNVNYEVQFRDSLASVPTVVPFSTTPTGTNRTSISGIDDYVTVYVERQTTNGFYQVAMRVSEV